jgi:DNA-binding transcriptional ArsR family regulator
MANALADSMTALGDPTRRAIFERLAAGPASVGALADGMPVSRPAVSQHLKVLKEAGLVIDRPAGNRRIYSLDLDGVAELRAYFERFWTNALGAFKQAAEGRKRDEEVS